MTECVNCQYTGPIEKFYDVVGNGGKSCPKCFREQPSLKLDVAEGHKACEKCRVIIPIEKFKKIITCKDDDYLLECPSCGHHNL